MPDSRQQLVFKLIRKNGGVLVRQKKHLIYEFPNGAVYTLSNSPSNSRAWYKALATLKRLLRRVEEK